jgi:multicomponent Na+:H+ antiporter subunit C
MSVSFLLRMLLLAVVLFGLWGVLFRRNLLFKVLAMDIMNTGVISLYVLSARRGGVAPVAGTGGDAFADPLPQAVIVTAIVIGFSILALLIVYVMDLSRHFHTLDADRIEERWRRD